MFYCTLLPIMGAATPSGVLRVLDRFDLIGWSDTLTPISRALLAAIAFLAGAPFAAYVAIWYVTDLAGDLFTWFLAWRELRRTGHLEGIRPTLEPDGAARRLALRHRREPRCKRPGDLGPDWAARRRWPARARRGRAVPRRFDFGRRRAEARRPARRAFYPEIVRMDLSTKKPWKLMLRVMALASGVAILAILLCSAESRSWVWSSARPFSAPMPRS